MIEYGHEFPDGTPMASVHLWCYRHWEPLTNYFMAKHEHFEQAIRLLWPEKLANGEKGYIWSDWAYRRLHSWCYRDYQTWWGPSSSGKSTDAGVLALAHWISAPDKTTITVCSTTKDMLERRIWREVLRFHSMYRGGLPGLHSKTKHAITYEDPDSRAGQNTINAIFALAVQKGTTAEAVGNMIGMHNDYNVLIIDEMQATRQAAVEAFDNLSTGKEAKFLGMGNPTDRLDPLGRASEPIDGWDTITPANDEWKTKRGWCLYFDGLKSPAIKEPKKYFFLLNKKQIDSMRIDPGEDSPRFWTQRRGFCPSEGLTETVLTQSFIEKFHMSIPAKWDFGYQVVFGLDPAFSSGGDRCVLSPAKVGKLTNGSIGVEFMAPILIEQKVSSGTTMTYYIANQVIGYLESYGVSLDRLAMDTTGAQRSLADVIETEYQRKHPKEDNKRIHRVSFGSRPSDMPVSAEDERKSCDFYATKGTELWFSFREFGRGNQIRGLGTDAAKQFCTRQLDTKYKSSGKIRIETKIDMKQRTGGKSPDHADSHVCVIDLVRLKMGILPGEGQENNTNQFSQKALITNDEQEDTAYLTDAFEDTEEELIYVDVGI